MISKLRAYIKILKFTFIPFGLGCVIADLIKIINKTIISKNDAIVDLVFLSTVAIICFVDIVLE